MGTCVAVLAALVVVFVVKDVTLGPVVCQHTLTSAGSCYGANLRG